MKKLALIALVVLAACASRPELPARAAGNPDGVDLSGLWVLRGPEGNLARQEEQTIVMPRNVPRVFDASKSRPTGRPTQRKGSSVHVFLESGKTLKVTQTAYGLFASFDRAVVEEVNFGEKRMVSVGPIEAQRVTGWDGETLIVETMDDDGNLLRESWYLVEGGNVLVRDIVVMKGDDEQMAAQQVFDRD